jgi:acyl carrier protein
MRDRPRLAESTPVTPRADRFARRSQRVPKGRVDRYPVSSEKQVLVAAPTRTERGARLQRRRPTRAGCPALQFALMRSPDDLTGEILDLASRHFGIDRATLGPHDDLFDTLGINSLQVLELLTRLEQHFSIELPDYELQGVSDARGLAERIARRL